jgi:hypothetical protein
MPINEKGEEMLVLILPLLCIIAVDFLVLDI